MPAQIFAVAAILLATACLQLANTLFAVVLPVRLERLASPAWLVGVVTSAHGAGFLLGCRRAHAVVRGVGHIRAFAALAALCCIFALTFVENEQPWLWAAMRLAQGFCLAGLFIIAEGWLNAVTPRPERGRVLSAYLIGTRAATIGGQMVLALGEPTATSWFVLAAGVFAFSLVPVALTRAPQPPLPAVEQMGLRTLARLAPAAVSGTVAAGLVNGAVLGLLPLYGARSGLSVAFTVSLLSLMQLGGLVLQWPLGWLSDRTDRRAVIVACGIGIALLSLLLPIVREEGWLLVPLSFLWGGFALSMYGLCVAHAADHAGPEQMVAVSGSALFAWAGGAAAGPMLAAPLMDVFGPEILFGYAAAVQGAMLLFVLWRIRKRAPRPREQRAPFVDVPATSPAVGTIDPRAPEPSRETPLI